MHLNYCGSEDKLTNCVSPMLRRQTELLVGKSILLEWNVNTFNPLRWDRHNYAAMNLAVSGDKVMMKIWFGGNRKLCPLRWNGLCWCQRYCWSPKVTTSIEGGKPSIKVGTKITCRDSGWEYILIKHRPMRNSSIELMPVLWTAYYTIINTPSVRWIDFMVCKFCTNRSIFFRMGRC